MKECKLNGFEGARAMNALLPYTTKVLHTRPPLSLMRGFVESGEAHNLTDGSSTLPPATKFGGL